MDQLVSKTVAASTLGISVRTLERLAARRLLPVRKIGKSVRFSLAELDSWTTRNAEMPLRRGRPRHGIAAHSNK